MLTVSIVTLVKIIRDVSTRRKTLALVRLLLLPGYNNLSSGDEQEEDASR